MQLVIDTNAAAAYTKKLEKMGKNALPKAVRDTLNKAAFDVKTNTMPKSADKTFLKREPNFFKANSRVEMAGGNDIAKMQAVIGFRPFAGTNKAIDDLEQQEKGGNIGGRSFVPLPAARTGGSWGRKPKRSARISEVRKNIVDALQSEGENEKEQWTKAAIHAGKGGWVLGTRKNGQGNRALMLIRSIVRKKGDTVIKATEMFATKKDRKVQPKATHFMEMASLQSAGKMHQNFITIAERQIAKLK